MPFPDRRRPASGLWRRRHLLGDGAHGAGAIARHRLLLRVRLPLLSFPQPVPRFPLSPLPTSRLPHPRSTASHPPLVRHVAGTRSSSSSSSSTSSSPSSTTPTARSRASATRRPRSARPRSRSAICSTRPRPSLTGSCGCRGRRADASTASRIASTRCRAGARSSRRRPPTPSTPSTASTTRLARATPQGLVAGMAARNGRLRCSKVEGSFDSLCELSARLQVVCGALRLTINYQTHKTLRL